MKLFWKYFSRVLLSLLILLVLYWGVMYGIFITKKERIRKSISEKISRAINGEVTIGTIGMNFINGFPAVSVSLGPVEIKDSGWHEHHRSLLKAENIFLRINPFSLIAGRLTISKAIVQNGNIYIFQDSTGHGNLNLLNPENSGLKKSGTDFKIEDISFRNIGVIFSDDTKNKYYDILFKKLECKLSHNGDQYIFNSDLNSFVHSLAFNRERGSYLKNKQLTGVFTVEYNTTTKKLTFNNIHLNIDQQLYKLSGQFVFGNTRTFKLLINVNNISYTKAINVLPGKIYNNVSQYYVDKPLNIEADISGELKYQATPRVLIKGRVSNSLVHTPAGHFLHSSFIGFFTNSLNEKLPLSDINSGLIFNDLSTSWENIPIRSKKAVIANLINPILKCDLEAETECSNLNDLLNSSSFDLVKGKVRANIYYSGPLDSDTATSINGVMEISKGVVNYLPRQVKLENINGRMLFNNEDLTIRNLDAEAQHNKVQINATIRSFTKLLMKDPSKLTIEAFVNSPSLDLYAFRSMLGSRRNKKISGESKFARLANKIDRFMEECSITSELKADKVKYKKFIAENLVASFSMNANKWKMNQISFNHAGGSFNLNGELEARQSNNNPISVNASLSNVNISNLFESFNNFGLQSLHSENLKGLLDAKIHLSGVLNDESRLVPPSLTGTAVISIRNGELINFEPLQKMAVFVLKKRDFSRVEFAELKNTFNVKSSLITIDKMEIQSNVLGLLLEGEYDVKGKQTDLVVQLPLKYLKKRKPDYVPENRGINAKTGISVFVRARNGENGDIDFKYGLFRKKPAHPLL